MLPNRNDLKRALDPRPARTRASILSAIERLGATGADLTVGTIVAEAGLSRSSFYSQFKDLGDVVVLIAAFGLSRSHQIAPSNTLAKIYYLSVHISPNYL